MNTWRGDPAWIDRYERLRAHATGHAPLGILPLGLALLHHRGVTAWMTATGSPDDAASHGRPGWAREHQPRDEVLARRTELVRLLAGAALRVATGSAP